VRFLVDANLSPVVALRLDEAGHDAVAVRDRGMQAATDDGILVLARVEHRVLISNDSDFGALLAFSRQSTPSFVLVRSADAMTPDEQAALLVANLPALEADLEAGAIATFARGRLRIRRLPLLSD
jgi:predicted nuclease of predicted toxin-antitoxin system